MDFIERAFSLILVATVIIWFLQSFDINLMVTTNAQNSILAILASKISNVFKPLGFGTWQITTALISGFLAKESVVSTLSVLYGSTNEIQNILGIASCLSLLTFSLLYTPCIAAVGTIKKELGLKFSIYVIIFQCTLAYIVALLVYIISSLFI